MRPIPNLSNADVAFGDVKHMPKMEEIPEEFQRLDGTVFNEAVSSWFFDGAKRSSCGGLIIKGKTFNPKPGVDAIAALRAIKAILGSFEPKHEDKEAACAYLLSEWFEVVP